jgi:hypothetical protein
MMMIIKDGFGSFAVDTKVSPYSEESQDVVGYAESMQEQYERSARPVDYSQRLDNLFAALEQNLAENKAGTFKE